MKIRKNGKKDWIFSKNFSNNILIILVSTILETNLDFILYFDYNRNEVRLWIILLDLNILKKLNNL